MGIGLNKSKYLTDVRFSYLDPYFTEDGVSRGFSIFDREAHLGEIDVANYSTSTLGGNMTFGLSAQRNAAPGLYLGCGAHLDRCRLPDAARNRRQPATVERVLITITM